MTTLVSGLPPLLAISIAFLFDSGLRATLWPAVQTSARKYSLPYLWNDLYQVAATRTLWPIPPGRRLSQNRSFDCYAVTMPSVKLRLQRPGSVLGVFLVPVLFVVVERIGKRNSFGCAEISALLLRHARPNRTRAVQRPRPRFAHHARIGHAPEGYHGEK